MARVIPLDRRAPHDGEQDAEFDHLFRTPYNALCVYAERLVRSHAVAEEIVDEVFRACGSSRGR